MITLDSIKIHAPAEVITDRNVNAFRCDIGCSEDGERVHRNKLIASGNIAGLKRIEIDNLKHEVQFELSAKILSDDYYRLINIDTIDQVFDRINRTGIIEIDKAQIDSFSIHSADCTKNLKGKHKPSAYLDNLAIMPQNTKYFREPYRGAGESKYKTGLVFRGKQKTFKERMVVYDKTEELQKEKQFIRSVNNPMNVLNQFSNVTRVECNFSTYARIRQFFGTSDQNLLRVLSSEKNPVFDTYKRIKGAGCVQLELFTFPETMKWSELVSYYGLRAICIDCNYDLSIIKDLIKKHVGKKTGISHQVKQVKKILANIGDIETGNKTDNEIIAEFEYLLKAG